MFKANEIEKYCSSPRSLANEVLKRIFKGDKPSFPIDPFVILDSLDVVYQFRDFEDLEGIYIVPEDEDDIAIVGINNNRPITRQRFTAAHELCHFLKDSKISNICPIDGRMKTPVEKFADDFASELLMPYKYLKEEVDNYCIYLEKRNKQSMYNPLEKYNFNLWKKNLTEDVKRRYESLHENLVYGNEKQDFEEAMEAFESIGFLFEDIDE